MKKRFVLQLRFFTKVLLILQPAFFSTFGSDRWEDSLTQIISTSQNMGLPVAKLNNKIREGHAKGKNAQEIYSVVRIRQAHLLHIRDENNGSLPDGYMRELFNREQKSFHTSKKSEHQVKNTHKNEVSRQHLQPAITTPQQALKNKKSGKTPLRKNKVIQPAIKNRQHIVEEKVEKQIERSEERMDKASARAERRMNQVEKRVQKRAMKRYRYKK